MRAEDLVNQTANDPEYQAMRQRKEAEQAQRSAMLDADEASLVAELREARVRVVMNRIPGQEYDGLPNSVWDLVNTEEPYPQAIPILLKHLDAEHHLAIREGIVRALAVMEARDIATERLIEEFIKIEDPNSNFKWVVGMAIAETTTPKTGAKVAALALDKAHGKGRDQLPLGMLSADPDEASQYLQQMLQDPVTKKSAEDVIKKLAKRREAVGE
ncbi:hypothetical protein MalM25_20190 [Planctomycetes bacterium MalM25]|nr:hypothetical protein MalM25_20190 [Planctomycetes bacterium MalM25]